MVSSASAQIETGTFASLTILPSLIILTLLVGGQNFQTTIMKGGKLTVVPDYAKVRTPTQNPRYSIEKSVLGARYLHRCRRRIRGLHYNHWT